MSLLLINTLVCGDLNEGSFYLLTELYKCLKTWQLLNFEILYMNVRTIWLIGFTKKLFEV